jgi:hypothetical protein
MLAVVLPCSNAPALEHPSDALRPPHRLTQSVSACITTPERGNEKEKYSIFSPQLHLLFNTVAFRENVNGNLPLCSGKSQFPFSFLVCFSVDNL